jgi:hypothetical protein
MPMGPSLGGFAYFAGTKFLGYSAFAHFLRLFLLHLTR